MPECSFALGQGPSIRQLFQKEFGNLTQQGLSALVNTAFGVGNYARCLHGELACWHEFVDQCLQSSVQISG